ncbi:glutamate 5-kinase [Aerococcus sanguinicola]|uniref:glutamate 5-kinase n=1 Tax=Aerococcus sanguinicola TaxID=119206 RepID=UPI001E2D93D9|nr:glutamate 5-kinase [Aerococcus sanguinicola]
MRERSDEEMERQDLAHAQRLVFKIGTNSLLTDQNTIDYPRIDRLAFTLASLRQAGKEVVLVSSGAIGVGCVQQGIAQRPQAIPEQQALAALGQVTLMSIYSRFFAYYNQDVAQILLTRDVMDYPESLKNCRNSLEVLLAQKVIPVINENDAVAVDELDHQTRFGDNDTLSALVSNIVEADLLVLLTDVDGFYTADPHSDPQAQRISRLEGISQDNLDQAGGKGSSFSTGGMATKLKAGKLVLDQGRSMVIMGSQEPANIFKLLAGKDIGSLVPARQSSQKEEK